MPSLVQRFVDLRQKIGGDKIERNFQYTHIPTPNEMTGIFAPSLAIRRLIGELEFALRLSHINNDRFYNELDTALTILEKAMETEGTLTKSVCLEAEEAMMPMQALAKEYEIILVGHAHIDMNWMWGWQETVSTTLATFRTMLNIMEEYPEFHFSQSQASVYEIVEKYDPDMMQEIKARIAEGRWEITASAWVETDKNMPNTESLLRHIEYTKTYLRDNWGVDPASLELDFSPDTFGHSVNLPEIDELGGVKYYYHCRALKEPELALYRWRGASGKEILCYREQQWYNSSILPRLGVELLDTSERCAGLKTGMAVYGVGDHGGGPTRRDVEMGIDMMSWPIYPRITFGRMIDFFKKAEAVRDQLPLVDHELNYIFPGCYTTQSRIKMGNRASERALVAAEGLNVLAANKADMPFYADMYGDAWKKTLFTHFHDILTGSCVRESREHAMGLYADAVAVAQTRMECATRAVADQIDISSITREEDPMSRAGSAGVGYGTGNFDSNHPFRLNTFGDGMPHTERSSGRTRVFHVFNPTAVKRSETVEITAWDWEGDTSRMIMTDAAGNKLPFQLDAARQSFYDHWFFRMLVPVEVEAFGYTTVVLREEEFGDVFPVPHLGGAGGMASGPEEPITLENKLICAKFDRKSGRLCSLFDKTENREMLRPDETGGLCVADTEKSTSDAWHIGRYRKMNHLTDPLRIYDECSGDVRKKFSVEYKWNASSVRLTVSLDEGSPALRYNLDADWLESAGETVPLLLFMLPLADKPESYLCDVPGGRVYRKPYDNEMPALQYMLAITEGHNTSAGIVNPSKYGYRGLSDGTMISTFIHSAHAPDPYPELGRHNFAFFVGVFQNDPKVMEDTATALNNPLTYQPARGVHGGNLPLSGSLLQFDSAECVISSVSMDGEARRVRLYNTSPNVSRCTLRFDRPAVAAETADLLGAAREALSVKDGAVVFDVPAFGVLSVKVTL